MSTQDTPGEGAGTSRLSQLASEDQPVVSDDPDPVGVADDPDAVDASTGRQPQDGDDPDREVARGGDSPGW